MLKRCNWLFFLLVVLLGEAQAGPIYEYQLNNGLKLIVEEDHRAPVVFSSIWYKVGGSYEWSGITGISHVLEHMMFRGTKKHPSGYFEKTISALGSDQNAMTSDDFTVYFERLSVNQLPIALELEADRMKNLSLNLDDFIKEIQVVMEERRMRFDDNPLALTYERFMATAFVNSPYHHQAIGWMTDLQHMQVEDVKKWYHTWYVPNNAILVIVGDVKPNNVLVLTKKYFGSISPRPIPKLKPRTEISSLGTKLIHVNIPATLPIIMMGYHTPSLTTVTVRERWQAYALEILATLLGGSDSSRFSRDLIRRSQIAHMAQVTYDPYQLHSTQLMIMGIPTQGHSLIELKKAFIREIKKLQTNVVGLRELNRVKAQLVAQKIYDKDSLMNQAMDIGIPEVVGLSWHVSQDEVKQIESITREQVQKVAQQYLTPDRLTIALLQPTGKLPKSNVQPLSVGLH